MASHLVACLQAQNQICAAEHADIILDHHPRDIFRHVALNKGDRAMQADALARLQKAQATLRQVLDDINAAERIYARALGRVA